MTAIALPAPFETPAGLIRLPRWARPWERTQDDAIAEAIGIDQPSLGEFAQDTSGSSIALTTAASAASGSLIVLSLTWVSTSETLSSVSGGGLTWSIDKQATNAGSAGFICSAIVSAQAPAGLASGTSITATLSGSALGGRSLGATSLTGIATSSPLDTTSGPTSNSGSGTAWASASTTIQAGSILLGLAVDFSSADTSTPTSPSVEAHDFGAGGTSFEQTVVYRIEPSAGPYTVAGAWSASVDNWSVICAAYKAAAATPRSLVADTRRVARNSLLRRQPVAVYMNALRPNWRPLPSGVLMPEYA
jgi:hypothetical protein